MSLAHFSALLGLGLPLFALAQADGGQTGAIEQQISGNVRLNYYQHAKQFDGRNQLFGASTELKLESRWDSAWRSKLSWRGQREELNRGDSQGEMLEAYALWHGRQVDLKLGKQIVAWGRADGINPTDNVSPRNYRIALPYEEDQRSGSGALKLNYFPDEKNNVTLYLAPGFQPSRVPLPTQGIRILDQQPAHGRWPLAVKWDQRGEYLDWSLSYFRGFKLIPELQTGGEANQLALHYPKISVWGADLAFNLGRYGVRAELARVLRDEPTSDSGMHNNWHLVTGIDRNFDDDFNLNLQWVAQHNSVDAMVLARLQQTASGQVNAVTFGQQSGNKYGITLRLGKKWWHGSLDGELLTFRYFGPGNAYTRAFLAYALRDNVKLTAGFEHYSGPSDSFFGRSKPLQTVFSELRYQF